MTGLIAAIIGIFVVCIIVCIVQCMSRRKAARSTKDLKKLRKQGKIMDTTDEEERALLSPSAANENSNSNQNPNRPAGIPALSFQEY